MSRNEKNKRWFMVMAAAISLAICPLAYAQIELELYAVGEGYYDVIPSGEEKGAARLRKGEQNRCIEYLGQIFVGDEKEKSSVTLSEDEKLGRTIWKAAAGKPRWVNPKMTFQCARELSRKQMLKVGLSSLGAEPNLAEALARGLAEKYLTLPPEQQTLQDLKNSVEDARKAVPGEEANWKLISDESGILLLSGWLKQIPEKVNVKLSGKAEGTGYWILAPDGSVSPTSVGGIKACLRHLELKLEIDAGGKEKPAVKPGADGAIQTQLTFEETGEVVKQASNDPKRLRLAKAEFIRIGEVRVEAVNFLMLVPLVKESEPRKEKVQQDQYRVIFLLDSTPKWNFE
jgi:hypothetical protein